MGASVGIVYGIGFLVANSYYGAFWVVDPSLLQARYAAAGILWFAFSASSVISAHYVIYLAGAWEDTGDDPPAEIAPDDYPPFGRLIDRYRQSQGWRRYLHGMRFWINLIVLSVPILLFFFGPVLPFLVLFSLGVHFDTALAPALWFHLPVVGIAILSHGIGFGQKDAFDFRGNPHRALLLPLLLVMHALLFGQFVYPLVPASSGGARPLPVRLALANTPNTPLGPLYLDSSDPWLDSAYIATSTNHYLVD